MPFISAQLSCDHNRSEVKEANLSSAHESRTDNRFQRGSVCLRLLHVASQTQLYKLRTGSSRYTIIQLCHLPKNESLHCNKFQKQTHFNYCFFLANMPLLLAMNLCQYIIEVFNKCYSSPFRHESRIILILHKKFAGNYSIA